MKLLRTLGVLASISVVGCSGNTGSSSTPQGLGTASNLSTNRSAVSTQPMSHGAMITQGTPRIITAPDGTQYKEVPLSASRLNMASTAIAQLEQTIGHGGPESSLKPGTKVYQVKTFAVTDGNATYQFNGTPRVTSSKGKVIVVDSETGATHTFSSSAQIKPGSGHIYVGPGDALPSWVANGQATLERVVQ